MINKNDANYITKTIDLTIKELEKIKDIFNQCSGIALESLKNEQIHFNESTQKHVDGLPLSQPLYESDWSNYTSFSIRPRFNKGDMVKSVGTAVLARGTVEAMDYRPFDSVFSYRVKDVELTKEFWYAESDLIAWNDSHATLSTDEDCITINEDGYTIPSKKQYRISQ